MDFMKSALLILTISLFAFAQQREQEPQSSVEGLVVKATDDGIVVRRG